ncbi:hypothetical protein VTK73DRAFT_6556 [Phialemonium thermophilum]|uniref:FAD dependent oxidoreductase domain-containing protein n=1 Tax=Phialemonium thermophilum TaxID=223376 RepID=A0ABR3XVE1_9PEZI
MPQHVVVIGAGVIGLSSAICLQEAGYSVTIVARDFPTPFEIVDPQTQINYTSPWGGAHNRWVPPHPVPGPERDQALREHALSLSTFKRMEALAAAQPAAGITFMPGIEYLESPGPEYVALTEVAAAELGMPGFRILRADEFPDARVAWGCEYRTWCVNPMVYCCFLLRQFVLRGGRIFKRELRCPDEVFALHSDLGTVNAAVNASGNGFGDKNMSITRGQTCIVTNPCDATVTRQNADGSWTFCVPRGFQGGTVIGGTKEPDNWDPEPSVDVRKTLLRRFAATYPRILDSSGKLQFVRDIVGRRPTRRGGLRLETERAVGGNVVVHAYGLGGRGYELSWGVAEEVVRLVRSELEGRASKL